MPGGSHSTPGATQGPKCDDNHNGALVAVRCGDCSQNVGCATLAPSRFPISIPMYAFWRPELPNLDLIMWIAMPSSASITLPVISSTCIPLSEGLFPLSGTGRPTGMLGNIPPLDSRSYKIYISPIPISAGVLKPRNLLGQYLPSSYRTP